MSLLDYAKHKNILLQILKDIYSDPLLGTSLGFKGGTAAFLFYGLERGSVDLDFDLLNKDEEDRIFKKISVITEKYGIIVESRIKHFNMLHVISYAPNIQKIKIEINRRLTDSHYEMKSLLGIPMLVIKKEDMFAHKLVAMYERSGKGTNRDIFDVHFFLKKGWSINKEIVEKRMNTDYKTALKKCIVLLEKVNNKNILHGLGDLLDKSQKDWARKELKKDTIFLLNIRHTDA